MGPALQLSFVSEANGEIDRRGRSVTGAHGMEDDDDKPAYEVGYGIPPKNTRFKKGQSGNPRGRPKGAKSWKTLLEEVLNERITVVINGKPRRITKKRALTMQAYNVAMRTDDLTMLKTMGAFEEPAEAQLASDEAQPERWRCTLMFDNEPQITTEGGEVVIDHRAARWKDTDESDWW